MNRTLASHTPKHLSTTVTVAGWVNSRRDHGGVVFLDLRDHTGLVQLTIHPESAEAFTTAERIRDEFVIRATGQVVEREAAAQNPNLESGQVEIVVENLEILNTSKPLPFPLNHTTGNINEDLRLKYRFLDLRRDKMQKRLRDKDAFITRMREYMHSREFTEVTTPILTSSSPEGARDFLVPSRIHPGTFYALPQAPQQFKQLLMVGGVPKYFQVATCFRDEDPRADRHPGEFYQLDLEMAFAEKSDDILNEVEPMIVDLCQNFAGKTVLQQPVPRISYQDAMEFYGSDKPDLRFDMKFIEVSEIFSQTEFSVFASALKGNGCIKVIRVPGGAEFSRSQIDRYTELAKSAGAGGLAYITYTDEGPKSPILKFMSETEITQLTEKTGAQNGDLLFFGADERATVNKVLGKLRSELGTDLGLKDPSVVALAWITNFPMYEWSETEKKVDFAHNPFSMPIGGVEALRNHDPLNIQADQYDMVANGYEICSGAIRNYNPEIMYEAFAVVGIDRATVDEKFGSMIRAFEYGAPPHGGCAFGIDRLFMILEDEPNIREVIAFPKNGSALDLMMNAPSVVDDKQLKELHIKVDIETKPTNTNG